MGKKEKFMKILRDVGISEYYATPDFNPESGTEGVLLIPLDDTSDDTVVFNQLKELYYPRHPWYSDVNGNPKGLDLNCEEKGSYLFNMILSSNSKKKRMKKVLL